MYSDLTGWGRAAAAQEQSARRTPSTKSAAVGGLRKGGTELGGKRRLTGKGFSVAGDGGG